MELAVFRETHVSEANTGHAQASFLPRNARVVHPSSRELRRRAKLAVRKGRALRRRQHKRKRSEGVSFPIVVAVVIVVIWGAIILFLITRREGTAR
jgi:cobalamin biosynthesis Mg chelatase CobN